MQEEYEDSQSLIIRHRNAIACDRLLARLEKHHGENIPEVPRPKPAFAPRIDAQMAPIPYQMFDFDVFEAARSGLVDPPARFARAKLADIQRAVSDAFGIPVIDLVSKRRKAKVCRARHAAMYLTRKLTTHSLPEIGRRFEGRDHSTVYHSIKMAESLVETDPDFALSVSSIMEMLGAHQ